MPIAIVFPGQGSQRPAAAADWHGHPAWSAVTEAEAATGTDLSALLLDPDADLSDTRSSQLSVLLASLVAWRALAPTLDPTEVVAVTGHSLGLITALLAADAVDPDEGFRLAAARAEACAVAQARRPGGMVALLGADLEQAAATCASVPDGAWVANSNGAGQVVVGARRDRIDDVHAAARDHGVRRTRLLPVDGAFHTPLMADAVAHLRPTLDATTFHRPRWPVVANQDGRAVPDADGWPHRLADHLVSPVRWDQVVATLVDLGVDHVIEVGPGSTLTGLVRRIAPDLRTTNVAEPADLAAVSA